MKKKAAKQKSRKHSQSLLSVDPGFSIETHFVLIVLCVITLLMKSLIFAPINWWPLTFVCLVPWLLMISASVHAPRVYFHSYLLGLAFLSINMRWMYHATGLGFVAFSFYLAVYFPLIACALRHVVRRRHWPLAITLPLIWTGSEMLRAVIISGFPWFFLSHSLYKVLPMIQISDLVGAYGVSFVVAAVNGGLADLIFAYFSSRNKDGQRLTIRRVRFSLAFPFVLVIATVVYGKIQLQSDTVTQGPKIAVIQGDHVLSVTERGVSDVEKMNQYMSMLNSASEDKPDLYLLPESPWFMYLNPEVRDLFPSSRNSFSQLREHAVKNNAYLVTGSASWMRTPDDLLAKDRRYNSATIFKPDGSEPDRYDKVHLVYFGEMVPFRFGRLRFLYLWLNRFMPWSGPDGDIEYSLFRGDGYHVYSMNPVSQPEKSFRFGVPICYEDVMPYIGRKFAGSGSSTKQADILLNISNDGWFGRGLQQQQHFAICVFRAVENRVGIARAVNTGVSGFIQPTGRIHDVVVKDSTSTWPDARGYRVANIGVDSRFTLYTRYGDWFAWCCALTWLLFFLDYWITRVRMHSEK